MELNIFAIVAGLLGGLALFLFGLELLSNGLKAVAGSKLKAILAKLTSNRFSGLFTGAFVTAIIQSSSVTTVLVVGFISAGLMKLTQSIGVIMGANIGSTVTAQIIAFKITSSALIMIALGFVLLFFLKNNVVKQYGNMIMGLGLVFLGMNVMSDGMRPLRDFQPFLDLMISMENPFLGMLVGAAFTALVQSSSATTGIVIALASQGLISLEGGIALIFGANIGTCFTAFLACIGKTREAVRAAMAHVLFNVGGVLLWLGFIDQLSQFVSTFGETTDAVRNIANAHTLFNVANAFIFIWFVTPMAKLIEWMIPDRPEDKETAQKPKYLEEDLLKTPALALNAVRLEISSVGNRVQSMLGAILPALISGNRASLDKVAKMDDAVDRDHKEILKYVREIGIQQLGDEDMNEVGRLISVANHIENIGDIIETDMVQIGHRRLEGKLRFSNQTGIYLKDLHNLVEEALSTSLMALKEEDEVRAKKVIAMKKTINAEIKQLKKYGAERLMVDGKKRPQLYSREMETVERLQRIYYYSKRIAKSVIAKSNSQISDNFDDELVHAPT